jgi:diguanylate cyclase (GGDEF)-like protein/PAS domain S-box-containing protein
MMKKKSTILAVDDTLASLKLLSDILKEEGYDVRAAQSGELALRSALAETPDLILLDIRMPGIDGFETCRQLKMRANTDTVPIIFLSATTDMEEKIQGFHCGAVDFISKPFQREELLARVQTHLNLHRLSHRLETMVVERTKALQESEERFRVLVEQAPDAILLFDLDNNSILELNANAELLWGWSRSELLSTDILSLYCHDQQPQLIETIKYQQDLALAGQKAQFECEILPRNGRAVPCEVKLVRLPAGERRFLRASFIDISERRISEAQILYLAHHDVLTGLANRFSLQQKLSAQIAEAENRGEQLAVMMLDLDSFKTINDARGHHVGDLLLTQVAERLRKLLADKAIVARQGGDEFIVVMSHIHSRTEVEAWAAAINEALAAPYDLNGKQLLTAASIGISLYPEDGTLGDELIRNSDLAMYQAKQRARGGAYFFNAELSVALLNRLSLEEDLRIAVQERQFELHYQPQLNLLTGKVFGVEALVRWRHPDKGLISPAAFIPVAEETGIIVAMGEWILYEACRQLKAWQDQGMNGVKVSVNLSAAQFQNEKLLTTVKQVLAATGLKAQYLDLEITETSAMVSPADAIVVMKDLSDLGVSISIDDFGTGYSSLAYLKQFPISTLKIDRSFVKDVEEDEDDAALCDVTTLLAHRLNLRVVAEGVETPGQLKFLTSIACDHIQGYLFCRPLPANEVLPFIALHATKPESPGIQYLN